MHETYITDIAVMLPNEPVSNDEVEAVLGLISESESRNRRLIQRNNGIKQRYYVIDKHTGEIKYNNTQLTCEAIKRLDGQNFNINDIECLACGTSSPDMFIPAHGVMVHGELGIPECEVATTAGVCASSVAALNYANMTVKCGNHTNAVVTGSDVPSLALHAGNFNGETEYRLQQLEENPIIAFEKEFLRWMLSDAAGAMVVRNKRNTNGLSLRIDWIEIVSYANQTETCMYAGGDRLEDGTMMGWKEYASRQDIVNKSLFTLKQDTQVLSRYTADIAEKACARAMEKHKFSDDSIDYVLPHISSKFFLSDTKKVLTNVGCPGLVDKIFSNLVTKGNTGAASIIIMLEELFHSGRLKEDESILCYVPESSRFQTSFIHLTVVSG